MAADEEVYALYGRESFSNAAGRAEDEGRETPFDTQFAEMRAHVAARPNARIGIERQDIWWRDDIWGRPGLDEIREVIRQHKCDVLLVHAPERLATKKQLGYMLAECELHGVRVEYVHGLPFDPNDPASALLQAAYEFAADWEHQRIRERTQRGLRTVIDAGRPVGTGRVRYGLVWRYRVVNPGAEEEKKIKVGYDAHPHKAKVVADLFRRAKDGATTRALVQVLHDAPGGPILSPTGKEWWTPSVVRNILHDPIYTGVVENLRWKRTKERKAKGGRLRAVVTARPAADRKRLAEGTAPPLVDDETFAAVQVVLTRNQEEASRRSRWPDATPLRGFAFCANCGRRLYVHPVPRNKTPWVKPDEPPAFVLRCLRRRPQERDGVPAGPAGDAGYGCCNWAHTDLLEEEVWESLMAELEKPAAADQAGQTAADEGAREQADVDAVSARLAGLAKQIALRQRQLLRTDPDAEAETFALFKTDLDRLRADHLAVQQERDERAAALTAARADGLAWDALRHTWGDALRGLPPGDRATAFRALRLVVRVWPDDPARRPPGADRWDGDVELSEAGLGAPGLTRLRPPDFARDGAAGDIVGPMRTSSSHNAHARVLTLRPAPAA